VKGSRRILAAAVVGVALAAAGCGGDEEGKQIPAATATGLQAQLDKVQARVDQGSAGACRDIIDAPESRGPNKQQVQDLIDSMPDDVDSDVKSALQDSFDNLWGLVEQDCEEKESEEEQNTTPTDTQEETTPTETEEETTPTTPETTPTETTAPEDEELPGGEGDGDGGGAVPDTGNGGGAGPSAQKQEKKEQKK
jgi:hypothetical protein